MQFTIVATLLSIASMASAAAVPTSQGPLSFIVTSTNEKFHGKWLSPSTTSASSGQDLATLSSSRYRNFFISSDGKLEYKTKTGTRTARINDLLKIYPLLATVSFQDSVKADADDWIKSEKTFKVNSQGAIDVRNGKQWFACTEANGSINVKVLVVGQAPLDKDACSEITLQAVDGIAK